MPCQCSNQYNTVHSTKTNQPYRKISALISTLFGTLTKTINTVANQLYCHQISNDDKEESIKCLINPLLTRTTWKDLVLVVTNKMLFSHMFEIL